MATNLGQLKQIDLRKAWNHETYEYNLLICILEDESF